MQSFHVPAVHSLGDLRDSIPSVDELVHLVVLPPPRGRVRRVVGGNVERSLHHPRVANGVSKHLVVYFPRELDKACTPVPE